MHNSFIVFIHSLEDRVGGVCAMLSWLNQSYDTCDARRRWWAIKSESNDYFALAVDLIKPQYLHISHLADLTHTHTQTHTHQSSSGGWFGGFSYLCFPSTSSSPAAMWCANVLQTLLLNFLEKLCQPAARLPTEWAWLWATNAHRVNMQL